MATKAEVARRRNIVLAALANFAKKEFDRDELVAGEAHDVKASVIATIGRAEVEFTVAGELAIGHDQATAKSAAPDTNALVAFLLGKMPKSTRADLLENFAAEYAKSYSFDVDDEQVDKAKQWLQSLRKTGTQTKRGAVTFTVHE